MAERFTIYVCEFCGRHYTDAMPCAGDIGSTGERHQETELRRIEVVPESRALQAESKLERAEEALDAYRRERDWLDTRLSVAESLIPAARVEAYRARRRIVEDDRLSELQEDE